MGHVTDINTDGVKDSEQPEVIDTYKKDLAAKRKAEEEERLRLKAQAEARAKALAQGNSNTKVNQPVVNHGDDEF